MQQHVLEPTHNLGDDNPARLDFIFSRNNRDVENLKLYPPLGKSHYAALIFDFIVAINVIPSVENEVYSYNFYKGNYVGIQKKLSETD